VNFDALQTKNPELTILQLCTLDYVTNGHPIWKLTLLSKNKLLY